MTDEGRLNRIDTRLQELRDLIGEEVTKVHNRINDLEGAKPKWWVKPATMAAYVGMVVIALGSIGTLAVYGLMPEALVDKILGVLGAYFE